MGSNKRDNKQRASKQEVYSISGFRDTLASPVFYPVVVVALVFGITSMFGFVQNPMKLKAVANVIHQKVAVNVVTDYGYDEYDSLLDLDEISSRHQNNTQSNAGFLDSKSFDSKYQDSKILESSTKEHIPAKLFDIFSDIDTNTFEKEAITADYERVAFNYDVTSELFWTNLDTSKLESAGEEIERQDRESAVFGIPLEKDYRDSQNQELETKDIYAIKLGKNRG